MKWAIQIKMIKGKNLNNLLLFLTKFTRLVPQNMNFDLHGNITGIHTKHNLDKSDRGFGYPDIFFLRFISKRLWKKSWTIRASNLAVKFKQKQNDPRAQLCRSRPLTLIVNDGDHRVADAPDLGSFAGHEESEAKVQIADGLRFWQQRDDDRLGDLAVGELQARLYGLKVRACLGGHFLRLELHPGSSVSAVDSQNGNLHFSRTSLEEVAWIGELESARFCQENGDD